MISTRQSGARRRNTNVTEVTGRRPSNASWIASRFEPGAIVLLGGSSVIDFRIRVAQAHVRADLLPSFWSAAGILASKTAFLSVPLDGSLRPDAVPASNGIHECAIADYDDPARYPNVAVLSFADGAAGVIENVRRLRMQRSALDLPRLIVPWLAYVWGAGVSGNPLLDSVGLPGAGMVETAFGMAGIEITPGVAAGASCPEAIWQSAIWWHDYYEKTATAFAAGAPARTARRDRQLTARVPRGEYITRQPAAAVVEQDTTPARQSGAARKRR